VSAPAVSAHAGRVELVARLRRLGIATTAGALAGVTIGGIGGRLAMLLLRVTSDPSLHGLKTDDGFTIGIVSGETTFLLIVTTVLGAAGGAAYFLVRPVLPRRWAPWAWGALGATVGGVNILRTEGIDFSLLEPLALAVAMFIAIPAIGAATTSVLSERWLRTERTSMLWVLGLAPLILVGLGGPTTFLLVAVTLALAVSLPVSWLTDRVSMPRGLVVAGRVALGAIGTLGTVALVNDVLEIL
jgi:hypothetical protein